MKSQKQNEFNANFTNPIENETYDYTLGEWSDILKAFWFGTNGCEFVAWYGSHQVFVYPCDEYPNQPSQIIQHDTRIESLAEFTKALNNGKVFVPEYKSVNPTTDTKLSTIEEVPFDLSDEELNERYIDWVHDQFTGGYQEITNTKTIKNIEFKSRTDS